MSIVLNGTGGTISGVPGQVLQVVNSSTVCVAGGSPTYATTTSTSFTSTGFGVTITPSSSSSKIYISVSSNIYMSGTNKAGHFTIYRGATNLATGSSPSAFCGFYNSGGDIVCPIAMTFLDSPATTSSTTYTVYFATQTSSQIYFGFPSGNMSTCLVNITAMEIAA